MKKTIKKIAALIISFTMVMSIGATILATDLEDGEVGGFAPNSQDTPTVYDDETVTILKELTAYNKDESTINAPTISYTYTVTAGGVASITDQTEDHESGTAVQVDTKAGVLTGIKVNGTTGATGTIEWTTDDALDASDTGEANTKPLDIDFSGVVFGEPGVYRYVITETLTGASASYAESGVTETTDATNGHTRYLDVYVKAADTDFISGETADEWDIYGFVCLYDDVDVTPDTVKINGFVAGQDTSGNDVEADSYYTYNVTVSKILTNDNYNLGHEFPMEIVFTNEPVTNDILLSATVSGNATDYSHAAGAVSSLGGTATIASGSSIKYIGIPCGTICEVTETNDATGVTYLTTLTVDGGTPTSKVVVYNDVSDTATITTTADEADDTAHTVEFENVLQMISPTGVIVRSAPYILLLGTGVALFVLSRSFKKKEEKDI